MNTREFTRTMNQYREFSKRDAETIVNTKAFYIARRAVIETPKASAAAIREFVSQKEGEVIGKVINKRRGARGERGLYGKEMAKMVATVRAARLRSVAFLKSGWLPAIKKLEPLAEKAGAPRADRGLKQYGQEKGYATPARKGFWTVRAIIANLVQARWDRGGAMKHGIAALQKAFDFEVKSMKEYIEKKLKASAQKAGIKAH